MLSIWLPGFLIFLGLAALAGWLVRRQRRRFEEEALSAAQAAAATPAPPVSPTPVRLRISQADLSRSSLGWTIGLSFGTLVLASEPELLWTRWLGYPAAALFAVATFIAFRAWREEAGSSLEAGPQGIVWRRAGQQRQLAWAQVHSVRLEDQDFRSRWHAGQGRLVSCLVIVDAQGQELLRTDAPMRPVAEYERLLASLPAWWGRPVERRRI